MKCGFIFKVSGKIFRDLTILEIACQGPRSSLQFQDVSSLAKKTQVCQKKLTLPLRVYTDRSKANNCA